MGSHKGKSADKRKPRDQSITLGTLRTYESACRTSIKNHHELMKNDPERLTTEFLITITGCKCKSRQ